MPSTTLEFIIQAMPDLLFRFNANGDFLQYYATQNKSLAVPADRIVGRNLKDFFDSKIVRDALNCIAETLRTGEQTSFEYELPLDGEVRYYMARMVVAENQEVICFVRDVTDRHLLQVKNEELVKINRELDSFVYSASHDLRAPLSSILGLTEIGLRSGKQEDMKSCLTMIKERVQAQDRVIHDIITYARNLRTEIVREKFNLKLLVFEVIDMLLFNEGASKIDFQVHIPDDFEMDADKTRLRTVLSNLLSNAIKYHDQGKKGQFVKIDLEKNSRLMIHVEDNGQGIPEDQHDKIFRMFYRGSEKSKGSGLGLFISKDTIEKLGGAIEFVSKYREGSRFTISIPPHHPS
ncbi:MAG TPA: ATP-binding protein [Cyclobacteriaceae bacterium]|jgi:signal transduction histidine kinase|nr:ATP-binding protein [Cyclobacteriaceae bacterium]